MFLEQKDWKLIPKSPLPEGTKLLPAVWSFTRKQRATTGKVYKHKARLTVGGHKQEYSINFWETYSPVVNWFTIRIFLILMLIHGWKARQMDFVLAFPQADIKMLMCMQIPKGSNVPNGKNEDYCLQLIKNVYGTRQGPRK